MYFDFDTFFRIAFISFFKSKDTPAPLSLKRLFFLLVFFTSFPICQLFHRICFLLDDLFFPQWRTTELEPPVFIIGNPRSGTTFMHRVLALDEAEFFFFRTWEIFFPSITQKKILAWLGRIDQSILREAGTKIIGHIEAKILRSFNKMHPTGLFYPEECEMLLFHIFSTYNLLFFFPFPVLTWFARFDLECPPKRRQRIMSFYRDCVRRQAYYKGNSGRLLAKNPGFTPKIESLYEYFPGCKIICMVRNPLEVIPSMLSIVMEIERSADVKHEKAQWSKAYEMAKFYYQYPLACFAQTPEENYLLVRYDDLVGQPSSVVRAIYRRFGLALSDRYSDILKTEDGKQQKYKSKHRYSLDQFQITREQIVSDLHEIFSKFDFSVKDETDSGAAQTEKTITRGLA